MVLRRETVTPEGAPFSSSIHRLLPRLGPGALRAPVAMDMRLIRPPRSSFILAWPDQYSMR